MLRLAVPLKQRAWRSARKARAFCGWLVGFVLFLSNAALVTFQQAALLEKLAAARAREEEAKKVADRDAELKRREEGRKMQAVAEDMKSARELAQIKAAQEEQQRKKEEKVCCP